MVEEEVWTVGRILKWTQEYLEKSGMEAPRLDAEILLACAMKCKRIELYTHFDDVPTEEVREQFKKMLRRRAEGMPVAYLVGKKEFYSEDFLVMEGVLIPRPETEFVLVGLFDMIKTLPEGMQGEYRLCDLGTGSGVLAIIAAANLPKSRVDAVDISPEALRVAEMNVRKHESKIGDRVTLHEGDLFEPLRGKKYDFVLTNPPYVALTEIGETLEENVFRYEPKIALFGGKDGTEVIRRIFDQAEEFLKPGGLLFLELSPMIYDRVMEIVQKNEKMECVRTIYDLENRERVLVLRQK
ncbi:MAG: peptide chain release factor N(5)-glutamine methyltransferase [Planctomycetia bacterium]|nr:peptide chain release factor N(5)-glutamine methyltransferase [Planctomycetia bacterium]